MPKTATKRIFTTVPQKTAQEAEKIFSNLGISLGDGLRIMLSQFTNGNLTLILSAQTATPKLSPTALKRYKETWKQIKNEEAELSFMDENKSDKDLIEEIICD